MPITTPSADVRVVPLGEDRREELLALDQWAFAIPEEDVDAEVALLGFEWDRTFGAEVDGDLAGIYSVYSLDVPVPGGEVPTAGLTWVGVHPQHRRRGVLREMARHHLHAVHDRGEALSALWAAEAGIYGRFGYGLATLGMRLTLPRRAPLVDVPGHEDLRVSLSLVDPEEHVDVVHEVFHRVRRERPGMASRRGGLARRVVLDPKRWRQGAESIRLLLVSTADGEPRGYALFRRTSAWEDGAPAGQVQVREAHAVDAAAARALWGRLTDLDLTRTVRTDLRPTDDALLHLLVDVRAAAGRVSDNLWVRVVDVPAALSARRYSREVDVVLEVVDRLCPWNDGRWRLTGGPDGATCERTTSGADLALGAQALGAAYLGGQSLTALASAGVVREERPGALSPASAALSWPVHPYCGWVF